jgi:tetratricopeptide (TPR) repeat protein
MRVPYSNRGDHNVDKVKSAEANLFCQKIMEVINTIAHHKIDEHEHNYENGLPNNPENLLTMSHTNNHRENEAQRKLSLIGNIFSAVRDFKQDSTSECTMKLHEIIGQLRALLWVFPEHYDAQYFAAKCFLFLSYFEDSLRAYEKVLQLAEKFYTQDNDSQTIASLKQMVVHCYIGRLRAMIELNYSKEQIMPDFEFVKSITTSTSCVTELSELISRRFPSNENFLAKSG